MTKSPQFVFTDKSGWFDVLRAGEFPNTRNGQHALQLTSPEDLAAIVAQWEAEGRPEFLVDSDHFSYDQAHDTRALGWGTGLRVHDGVLQAQVRWSAEGQKDLDSGSYRFCSISVHTRDEPDQKEGAGKDRENPVRVRPFRLDSIALTNRPNIPGLRPLTNRATAPVPPPQPTPTRMDHKAIAALLGLPDTATDAEITNAATVLNNRARSAEEAAADADLARFAGVIADAAKPYWKSQLVSNRAAALPVLEGMLAASAASGQQKQGNSGAGGFKADPLHNRGDAVTPPAPGSGNAGAGREMTEADKMARQNAAISLVMNRNRGISHSDAFNIARTENPALFQ